MQDGRGKDCPDNKGLNEVWLDHCLIAICLPSTIIQVHSPRPVITTLHLHTQLHCRSLRGRSLLCRRGRKTHNQLFKIQLNYDFRSLSQTHNAYHRRSALLWFVLVFAASRTLMETFIFECPTDFPPKSRWEPLRPERSTGSLGLMVIQAERDREEQRGFLY